MKQVYARPEIVVSRCLGFDKCRWNGESVPDKFVDKLKAYVDFLTVCPEVETGLGVPRDPVRIVAGNGALRMLQFNTGREITGKMEMFSGKFLEKLGEVDGFILKDRSPSCGIKDVKIYPGLDKSNVIGRTSGLFAGRVLEKFPAHPVESEARLSNYTIREHFLTRIFTLAAFRELKPRLLMKDLVQFHAGNKLLLMAFGQKELNALGGIAANHGKRPPDSVFAEYGTRLRQALSRPLRYRSNINVMMHAFGYFSRGLSSKERTFFLNSFEEYRREQVPLSVPLRLLREAVIRFEVTYLEQQTFFFPYPAGLVEITDSGKGRGA